MARLIYRPGYFLTARHVAPQGSTTAKKLQATLRELLSEWPELPGPEDAARELPPVSSCWTRRVRGTALLVCFTVGAEGVTILAVKILGS